jgi:hypothetical protein
MRFTSPGAGRFSYDMRRWTPDLPPWVVYDADLAGFWQMDVKNF